jgi:hypothetical protein
MKRYVIGCRQKDEDKIEPPKRPFDPVGNVEVQYGDGPDWKMPFREYAETELRTLAEMRIHVGPHYCEFSLEELPEGEFAIVCLSHPEPHPSGHNA